MNTEEMEEIKRHFGVVAESLRSDIRQIAEGHATIRHELHGFREEFRDEFKEMRALKRLSFSQLDQRISALETDICPLNLAWIVSKPAEPKPLAVHSPPRASKRFLTPFSSPEIGTHRHPLSSEILP